MNNLLDTFIENGVYSLKNSEEDNLFITEAIGNKTIGKLVMYENVSLGIYYKTNTQYFINDYKEDDIKEVFLNRTRYDMRGILGTNYIKEKDFLFESDVFLENFKNNKKRRD